MWTQPDLTAWAARIKAGWSASLAAAWDDTVTAYRSAVEADPAAAERDATEYHDILFSSDPARPGIWYGVGQMWGMERQLPPAELAVYRQQIAARLDLPVEECTGDAMARAAEELTLPFLKDCTLGTGKPGIIPILVAGLVIGIGALCWAKVRLTEARVEHDRVLLAAKMLQEKVAASKQGRTLDLRDVANTASPPPAPSSGGGALLLGGLVVAAGIGGFLLWSKR